MHYIILYNEKADNGRGLKNAEKLKETLKGENLCFYDVTRCEISSFIENLKDDESLVISGGDGTLNRFINSVSAEETKDKNIFYHAAGSGNDFANDIELKENTLTPIYPYLLNLPTVTVLGKDYKFINGVGFGLDGFCCEEGDRIRETSTKTINYTKIAIAALLFKFKKKKAQVTVDGITRAYENVWIVPTMFGRFYGGGMMTCPNQDRKNPSSLVSVAVVHAKSKLKLLSLFPSIFKGTHIKATKNVEIFEGKKVTVSFDSPSALQIDGETISNVLSYHVSASTPSVLSDTEKVKEA